MQVFKLMSHIGAYYYIILHHSINRNVNLQEQLWEISVNIIKEYLSWSVPQ